MSKKNNFVQLYALAPNFSDAINDVADQLLSSEDIDGVLRILHESCFDLVSMDKIYMTLTYPGNHKSTMYCVDKKGQVNTIIDKCAVRDYIANSHALSVDECNKILREKRNVGCHYSFSIILNSGCSVDVDFCSDRNPTLYPKDIQVLRELSEIVSFVISNILDLKGKLVETPGVTNSDLLVSVTNKVMTAPDMKRFSRGIFEILANSLGVLSLSLMSLSRVSNDLLRYDAGPRDSEGSDEGVPVAKNKTCANWQVVRTKKVLLYRRNEVDQLAETYHCNSLVMTPQANSCCILPLLFRGEVLGALRLTHERDDFFAPAMVKLFNEVAARIAMGVSAYQLRQLEGGHDHIQDTVCVDEPLQDNEIFSGIISRSEAMREVLQKVLMVADSDCTVLILGETGTGKELVAQAIHRLSKRSNNNMVKMNCSAVPVGLFESDLFGHEKGAFTGAISQRIGRFEYADKGTLFLDELGDMPMELQPKLLRALEEGEIERVGRNKLIKVDVRMIAATNSDLYQRVKDNRFRSDLYYRLNVMPIVLPPLRERREDIPLLAKHFTQQFARKAERDITRIPAETLRLLSLMPWEGNVRELRNFIHRAVLLTRGPVLEIPTSEFSALTQAKVASAPLVEGAQATVPEIPKADVPAAERRDVEREQIVRALKQCNGIVAGPRGAATVLGMKRTTLLSRMQRLGISTKCFS
ncbi:sigma 54-interacting transcriptional regulator [Ferrimonas balearica]|uniref:sigma 54-interacting transcriptional regulator n=1 Tax=Ferrimonas balearica TaxID=44012 RepID=UPI001C94F17A|nr:sigma 54-interacting transcriptional regulator [Ferrimonas balearica]MBY5979442.1 sigma 54-interacting transcriptional regulator [Ferrimonas balearica]